VLAVTADGKLVVVLQSEKNRRSPGLYAPSGSGSLEQQDFRGADSIELGALASNGALRELSEETAILEAEVRAHYFLGFGRWLNEAASPELLTIAFLTIDSHEVLRRRIPTPDRPFNGGTEAVSFAEPPGRWKSARYEEMVALDVRRRLSVPLAAALALLADAVRSPESRV